MFNKYKIALSLEERLKTFDEKELKKRPTAEDAFSLLIEFDKAVGYYYGLKAQGDKSNHFKRFQEIVVSTSHELLRFSPKVDDRLGYKDWVRKYREIWKRNIELFIFCSSLFVVSCMVGWIIGVGEPSYASLLIDQEFLEKIMDHDSWFARLQENPLMGGLMIAVNNIRVALGCFVFGAFLGIGGIGLLCFNGIHFGVVFGYCMSKGFHRELFDFVLSHGFLELTIIVASVFAGLLMGRVFYLRPLNKFVERFKIAASEAGTVALGVIPWLALAAVFEGFVSPFHYLSAELKMIIGVILCATFIFWTFKSDRIDIAKQN